MCEIFPEVQSFCAYVDLRIGMVIISIIAIMTGSTMLAVLEKYYPGLGIANLTKDTLTVIGHFIIYSIFAPSKAMNTLVNWIPHGITIMCWCFMIFGFILMFATFTDQEGFAQIFVWGTFLTVVLGFLIILAIAYQCMVYPDCFITGMDWLTSSVVLFFCATYLLCWIYFITVVNSYVLQT